MRFAARSSLRSVALLCAIGLVAGCGGDSGSTGGGSDASTTTIKVGMTIEDSGTLGVFGRAIKQGAVIATEELNEADYLGSATLDLDIQDNRGDKATAVSQYKAFEASDVVGVLCCVVGTTAGALKPLATAGGMPTVMTSAASKGLPELPNFVRVSYDAAAPGGLYSQTVDAAAALWQPKRAVMVLANDSPTLADPAVLEVWHAALARNGIELVSTVNTLTTDKDFAGAATKVLDLKPDVVLVNVQANSGPLLLRALQQQGYTGHKIGNYSMALPSLYDIGGPALEGLTFAAQYSPVFDNPMSKEFVRRYVAKYNEQPDFFSVSGYNGMRFMAQAVKDAGVTTDRKAIADAMSKITTLETPAGTFEMRDGDAHFTGKATIVTWNKDGTVSLVAEPGR
ncbi:ABC transporter substrate-binding protein [Pseudonocardia sp.]